MSLPRVNPMASAELAFWRGILRDHTILVHENLSPSEGEAVERAAQLRSEFEHVPVDRPVETTVGQVQELIAFQRDLLARLNACKLMIHLHAADLTQMIHEAKDFLGAAGVLAPPHAAEANARLLHLHNEWLWDAALHTTMVYSALDPSEAALFKELRSFDKELRDLTAQAMLLRASYAETGQPVRALLGLTREAVATVESHVHLLEDLKDEMSRCELAISAPPLMPDHFIREENHYLMEVARVEAQL